MLLCARLISLESEAISPEDEETSLAKVSRLRCLFSSDRQLENLADEF